MLTEEKVMEILDKYAKNYPDLTDKDVQLAFAEEILYETGSNFDLAYADEDDLVTRKMSTFDTEQLEMDLE